jgi:hypothetical protein
MGIVPYRKQKGGSSMLSSAGTCRAVQDSVDAFCDFDSRDAFAAKFNWPYLVAGEMFHWGELSPLADDMQRWVVWTVYFSRKDTLFDDVVQAMKKLGVPSPSGAGTWL